ncbi:universal stress protein [Pseudonocardia hydrocarbonoxydans]|uniref:universal stress protein n=1 Tax=Pseudonocardia hydrocarbonoxydans TaxID=76726 RepID=UPI0031D79622
MPLTGTRLPHPSPALAHREIPHGGGVLVVVGGDAVPGWVERWCARSGRDLRRQLVPNAAPDRVGAIGMIAASAARAEGAVLALPSSAPARRGPPRVVVAVRDLPDDAQAVADAAASAAQMGAGLVVAHGVPMSFGERSVGLDAALDRARRLLDAAVDEAALAAPGVAVEPWLARAQPHELVGEELDADLLVLGGPRADVPGRLGLVACSALHHAPCAVLLVPRPVRSLGTVPTTPN